ncbi:MAG: c-type cytochrome [Bacteroidota bacterium]
MNPIPLASSAVILAALITTTALAAPPARDRALDHRQPEPTWNWPEHAKNLKVLSRDTAPDRLRTTMFGFTRALGVRCSHCHVGDEGQPLSTYDFASDRNPKKNMARGMMRMVRDVNADLDQIRRDARAGRGNSGRSRPEFDFQRGGESNRGSGGESDRNRGGENDRDRRDGQGRGRGGPVNVECVTCHRGLAVPRTLAQTLTATYDEGGADAALEQYRSLRKQSLESGSYDFREGSLQDLADHATERGDTRGAIAIHEENARQFPESARVQDGLAHAYEAGGDTKRAIESYQRALKADPRDERARDALDRLQGR